jgi:hypothetical protein
MIEGLRVTLHGEHGAAAIRAAARLLEADQPDQQRGGAGLAPALPRARRQLARIGRGARVEFAMEYLTPAGPCRRFAAIDPRKGLFRTPAGEVFRLRGWRRGRFEVLEGGA